MSKFNSDNFINNYAFYHKIIYIFAMLTVILNIFIQDNISSNNLIIVGMILLLFFIADSILYALDYFGSYTFFMMFRYIEVLTFSVIQGMLVNSAVLCAVMLILVIYSGTEFILQGVDYDTNSIQQRKYAFILPMVLNIIVAYDQEGEGLWFAYFVMEFMLFIVVQIVVNWFVKLHIAHEKEKNKLIFEMSQIETNNTKLLEYQERVKTINEQINYQKFDLAKAYKELAQVNIEVSSQTEVMKYMTSTFDILKSINVLTDAIMDVKKPKFCAIYVDKNVYMNEFGSCIIKTNYSSLQRRLNKEIESIFGNLNSENNEIIYDEDLKKFKFIGDANINAIAVMPFIDGDRMYGMMLVGSDDRKFFSKGLGYFENCIVEFNVAVNRTRLYLQMQDMARKDGLTGIYNRIYFNELFENAISDTKRRNKPIAVAMFDIDKFKSVNDTYGHIAGDMVIKMVANAGQKYADRHGGFTCRYGGEEFLLVLPDYDENMALPILEKLHNEIKNTRVKYNDMEIDVNVCIGLTSYPNLCNEPKFLVSRADNAMYYGKKNGRGRLIVDGPMIDSQ